MLPKSEVLLTEESLERYCAERVPPHARSKVRMTYKWRDNTVTLIEERPYFQDPKRYRGLMITDRSAASMAGAICESSPP